MNSLLTEGCVDEFMEETDDEVKRSKLQGVILQVSSRSKYLR